MSRDVFFAVRCPTDMSEHPIIVYVRNTSCLGCTQQIPIGRLARCPLVDPLTASRVRVTRSLETERVSGQLRTGRFSDSRRIT